MTTHKHSGALELTKYLSETLQNPKIELSTPIGMKEEPKPKLCNQLVVGCFEKKFLEYIRTKKQTNQITQWKPENPKTLKTMSFPRVHDSVMLTVDIAPPNIAAPHMALS